MVVDALDNKAKGKVNVTTEVVCDECGMVQDVTTRRMDSGVYYSKVLKDPSQNYKDESGRNFSRVFIPSCRYC